MVADFAERFKIHPDIVFKSTNFDTVTSFLIMWKEEGEASDRYHEAEKMLTAQPVTNGNT